MKIFYRVSPYLSTHPNPMGTDKHEILDRCLASFLGAFPSDKFDITFIVDGLPLNNFAKYGKAIFAGPGNAETFHAQLDEIAKLPNEEKVFIVEDDYLWTKDASEIVNALDVFELVSPYDHPGHYIEERFKNQAKRIRLHNGHTYRDAPSNTLTFATHAYVIKQNLELIKTFGIRDHELFQSLGIDMWIPVPSFATHLVDGLLAPNVDWEI